MLEYGKVDVWVFLRALFGLVSVLVGNHKVSVHGYDMLRKPGFSLVPAHSLFSEAEKQ